MTSHKHEVVFLIMEEYFGPIIASVCEELKWGSKPLRLLSTNLKLPMAMAKQALSVMINFNFVSFKASESGSTCEYSLLHDNILLLIRYPRFLFTIREKYGKEAEFIIQELLYSAKMTLYNLIIKVAYNLTQANSEITYSLNAIKSTVWDLIDNDYIMPVERVTDDIIPVSIKLTEIEKEPKIDMQKLSALYHGTDSEFPKNELYWKVNFNRFTVEYRNDFLIDAMIRKNDDANAGIVMRHILKMLFSKNNSWSAVSNPLPIMMIRESISCDTKGADALKYADQYIKVMEEDSSGFIKRSIDKSGGILVCFKDAIESLTHTCISQIVEQKFGCKAARIFRAVKTFNYMTVEMIQKAAMMADKEAKQITYKLLEENFLQIVELRKPTSGSTVSGPNKSFFLFHVELKTVVKMVLGMCYQAIHNLYIRHKKEENKQIHIIEKKKQTDLILKALKEQEASEEQIAEMINVIISPPERANLESLRKVTKKLFHGSLQIDETILLLELYDSYNNATVPETKLRKRKLL